MRYNVHNVARLFVNDFEPIGHADNDGGPHGYSQALCAVLNRFGTVESFNGLSLKYPYQCDNPKETFAVVPDGFNKELTVFAEEHKVVYFEVKFNK